MKQSNVKAGVVVQAKKSSLDYDHFKGLIGIVVGLSKNDNVLVDFSTETTHSGKVLHNGNNSLKRGVKTPTTNTCWYFHSSRLKLVKE